MSSVNRPLTTPGSSLCLESFADLTPEEARAMASESGYGVTLDGLHAYWPGIPCYECGKFVGRDGHIGVEHFEMSSEIASVEGLCRGCIDGG